MVDPDYLPEVAETDRRDFPTLETLAGWLGGTIRARTLPLHRDGFARMAPEAVDRVVDAVGRDLRDGTWDARHGHLRALAEYDVWLRLLVSTCS